MMMSSPAPPLGGIMTSLGGGSGVGWSGEQGGENPGKNFIIDNILRWNSELSLMEEEIDFYHG